MAIVECDKCGDKLFSDYEYHFEKCQGDRIKKLKKALEFYADEDNWTEMSVEWGGEGMSGWTIDTGRKARECLEECLGDSGDNY